MKNSLRSFVLAISLLSPMLAAAQVPVKENTNHEQMLASPDPVLAANKRLVYDFWREVIEAGHLDLAEKYMAETYIQHNPNAATGRAGFVEFFSKFTKPKPIEPRIKAKLISIVAEGDMVVLNFVEEVPEPKNPSKKYTTTWFDMLRIENGKLAEHWDSALKQ
jgi:predicted SnoaL-like aldol condensation-catalyzing enzyme